jgi:hypothetical protein
MGQEEEVEHVGREEDLEVAGLVETRTRRGTRRVRGWTTRRTRRRGATRRRRGLMGL